MAVGLPRIYRVDDPVVEAVMFHGLPGFDESAALHGDWTASLPWIVGQRLAGVAVDFIRTHDLRVPDEVRSVLARVRTAELARTMVADVSAARVTEVMNGASVPFIVVKGPAIANLDPVPGARPYTDVDIVVAPQQFEASMRAARAAGFESNTDRPARNYYERLCYEGVNMRDAQNRSIDIHHHVPPWWAGKPLTYDYLARSARLEAVAGVDAPLASAASNLFIAALHLVSDQNLPGHKLLSWRDVMLTASLVDSSDLAQAADDLGLAWWLHWIIDQMPRTESLEGLKARLEGTCDIDPPQLGTKRVKALCAAGERGQNLAFAARLPTANAMAYVAGQVVPSRASRAARLNGDSSLIAWWRFAARSFLGQAPAQTTHQLGDPTGVPPQLHPPLFVGLPVYNGMPYLREAVDSLQAQTVKDFRCIVIDDGSTDGTAEYLDSLDDDRFLVVHQPNRGLVATLNTIVEMCPAGSWLVRHDADDIAAPRRLEVLLPHLKPDVALVHTGATYLGSPGNKVRFRSTTASGDRAHRIVQGGRLLSVCHPSAALNVDMVKQVGGYRDLEAVEDIDLWWRLALVGAVHFLPDTTLHYRVTSGGISQSALRTQALRALYVQYLLLSHLRGHAPRTYEQIECALKTLLDEGQLKFRAEVRDAQIAVQQRQFGRASRLIAGLLLCSPKAAWRRTFDEVRHWLPTMTVGGTGVEPKRFDALGNKVWGHGPEGQGATVISLPSGQAALELSILGARIALVDGEQLTREVESLAAQGRKAWISNHNLHSLALLRQADALRTSQDLARFAFADGMSVVAICRLAGLPASRVHRTTFLDWMPHLFGLANQHGWRIAHLGSTHATNVKAAEYIKQHYPRIDVAYHPGFFDAKSPDANQEIAAWLHDVSPMLLFVGMGMPRQEQWIMDNWELLPEAVILNSGGFFALLGGEQLAPPRWMGPLGLEWLGRLAMNPRRTWHRYLVEPLQLVAPLVSEVRRARQLR